MRCSHATCIAFCFSYSSTTLWQEDAHTSEKASSESWRCMGHKTQPAVLPVQQKVAKKSNTATKFGRLGESSGFAGNGFPLHTSASNMSSPLDNLVPRLHPLCCFLMIELRRGPSARVSTLKHHSMTWKEPTSNCPALSRHNFTPCNTLKQVCHMYEEKSRKQNGALNTAS
eukprot:4329038-Amphidinium_carterae.2